MSEEREVREEREEREERKVREAREVREERKVREEIPEGMSEARWRRMVGRKTAGQKNDSCESCSWLIFSFSSFSFFFFFKPSSTFRFLIGLLKASSL